MASRGWKGLKETQVERADRAWIHLVKESIEMITLRR